MTARSAVAEPSEAGVLLEGARARARDWLLSRQHGSGAWMLPLRTDALMPSAAMTVLALTALSDDSASAFGAAIDTGLAWLAERQTADGSFGDGDGGRFYQPYCTGLALWVLPRDARRHASRIAQAVDYLRRNQRRGGRDRGGIGFGMIAPAPTASDPGATFTRAFAMISPTSMAASGMRRAGVEPGDQFLADVIAYVHGCHNDPALNARPQVVQFLAHNGYHLSGDGGIVATLENLRRPAGWTGTGTEPVVSSGISTYQGLTAYLEAGLRPDSPEVRSALRWVWDHYSVAEHAGFAEVMRAGQRPLWPTEHGGFAPSADPHTDDIAQAGRYLYLFSMAQALSAASVGTVQTADGERHDWRAEIGSALLAAQRPEGCWINPNPRWLEFDAVLSTSFALSTINILTHQRPASRGAA